MTQLTFFATTGNAVARVSGSLSAELTVDLRLEGSGAQCVAVDPDNPRRVYVGTMDRGLYRSRDGGETWQRVGEAHIPSARVLSVAFAPARREHGQSAIYAGTEPSNLYRSPDDGDHWQSFPHLLEVPSAPNWSFPPRPWTSHVRTIAPHPIDPDLLCVGIELGGVMRSRDGGESWEDYKVGSHLDAHALATHPTAPGHVYEAAGDGVAFSADSGESWQPVDDGMDRHYSWALAVDAGDAGLWFVSAAPSAGHAHSGQRPAEAFIYRKRGLDTWERLGRVQGLPEPFDTMPYALMSPRQQPGFVIAGLRTGELLYSDNAGDAWHHLDTKLPSILAFADAT